ncbi:hypothetical protein Btru_069676 [Bulinus truncatus]|nr:hypothetical protein Btru_069676 [Bulinus truncatus]
MKLLLFLLSVAAGGVTVQGGFPCTVEDTVFEDGDLIYPDCFPCYCVNGVQKCFWQKCDTIILGDPCYYNGTDYFVGEEVPLPGATCYCIGASAMCDRHPIVDESSLPQGGGKLCPEVPDTPEPGSCDRCSCNNGFYTCTLKDCPNDEGQPCVVNGETYKDGAFIPDPDYQCVCVEGVQNCIKVKPDQPE